MPGKVLFVLSQRPLLTGSGVVQDALARHAGLDGWRRQAIVGVPAAEPRPRVADLPPEDIKPLHFGQGELAFPVPGMSDVMPYPSSRFSDLSVAQLDGYRSAWRRHLQSVIAGFDPDLIHTHHVWLVSSLIKDIAPQVPVINQCHATGLRQMSLCPHLADEVKRGCARNDRFLVLHQGLAEQLAQTLAVAPERVQVVGNGYREDLFQARGRPASVEFQLLYIGKYSAAKGLPWLLDAVERLREQRPELRLHVAGSGAGREAERLRARMLGLAPTVVMHGQLAHPELADLMRRCAVCVLPSFYEGIPLVLVEALACGCRLVSTRLPGIEQRLLPHLGAAIDLVPLPRLRGIDTPEPADLPAFVENLTAALAAALSKPPLGDPAVIMPDALAPFTWSAVWERVAAIWRELTSAAGEGRGI